MSEVQKQQAQQAEHALEDFKSQVERNSGRMFDEMKAQVQLLIRPEVLTRPEVILIVKYFAKKQKRGNKMAA